MPAVFVASYSLKVREKNSKSWLPLKFGNVASLREIVLRTLTNLKSCKIDEEKQTALRVKKLHSSRTDVWGLIEAGDFGFEEDLIHAKTLETSYTKNTEEAAMVPLYFRFHLPDSGSRGIFIIQRLGNRGALGALKSAVHETFTQMAPGHHLAVERLLPTEVEEALAHGGVRELTITAHTVPSDLADKIQLGGSTENVFKVELRVVAKNGLFLSQDASDLLARIRRRGAKLLETPDEDPTVRLRVDYGGRERLVDFQRLDTAAPYIDITNEVTKGRKGHPVFSSIDEYCVGLRNDLLGQLGLEAPE